MASPLIRNVPLKVKQPVQWQLDENDSVASVTNRALGNEFANAIVAVATGTYDSVVSVEKKYPPFKQVFWDDSKYNPPLANTHLSYELSSQIDDIERSWKKAGHRFTTDRRMARHIAFTGLRGPTKSEEYPYCMERPQKLVGRKREIKPFAVAHKYNKPVERVSDVLVSFCHNSLQNIFE